MKQSEIKSAVSAVCARIAPLWPLKDYVAVNPYQGFSKESFDTTAQLLRQRAGIQMTMPLSFYQDQLTAGVITLEHLQKALKNKGYRDDARDFVQKINATNPVDKDDRLRTLIDLFATECDGIQEVMIDSLTSTITACLMDQDNTESTSSFLFAEWRKQAAHDRSPEVAGVKGFSATVDSLPHNTESIHLHILSRIGIEAEQAEAYFHTLLLKLNGWASFMSGLDWNNRLFERSSAHVSDLLTIMLVWEYAVFVASEDPNMDRRWMVARERFFNYAQECNEDLSIRLLLQDAFDLASQNMVIEKLNGKRPVKTPKNPEIQAIFCIDVRSEVVRRHIESFSDTIQTRGFAGFFGFPVQYQAANSANQVSQGPVLIPATQKVVQATESSKVTGITKLRRSLTSHFRTLTREFTSDAFSAYGFVSSLGIWYLPKLIRNTTVREKTENGGEKLDLGHIAFSTKVEMACNALKVSGLQHELSELVLLIGHGSTSVNNPHAAGLACGACGGHSGKVNALVAAQVLNDAYVRAAMIDRGFNIPDETVFVAGLHDTTTDKITLYPQSELGATQAELLRKAVETFEQAGRAARTERLLRLPNADGIKENQLYRRGADWSQVRPEWGLAGCNAFIIGPRKISEGLDLNSGVFLHDYQHKHDVDATTLEVIMTAPMVVTSWINLQYYASVTDNRAFGAGNKTLHNVTAGIGVLEGLGGDLRTGLPLQSVNDGEKYQHMPNRLCVMIAAPTESINAILQKHAGLQQLFDNNWLHLYQLNDNGQVGKKYIKACKWQVLIGEETEKMEKVLTA